MTSTITIAKYYDDHIAQKINSFIYGNARIDVAFKNIMEYISTDAKNILEIGCGIGDTIFVMSKQMPGSRFVGIDISPKSVDAATKLFGNNKIKFICTAFEDANFTEKFDVIIMNTVYEHIPQNERNIFNTKLSQLLSEKGKIMMMFIAPRHLDFLKKNYPEKVQPVDENIFPQNVLDIAAHTKTELVLFKELSINNPGDYCQVVLSKAQEDWNKVEFESKESDRSLKKIILQNNILSQKTMRKSFVNLRLGTSFSA